MDTPKLTKNEELNLKGVAAELHATILRRHLGNVKGQAKWKNGKFVIEYSEDSITIQGEFNGQTSWRKFDVMRTLDEEHSERILQHAICLWAETAAAECTKGLGWRRER